MAYGQAVAWAVRVAPKIARQLPKLWPLLLESKNRERLREFFVDLASASPAKRLRARVELTAALADHIVADATNDQDREKAAACAHRARNMSKKLEMPVQGHAAKRAHRQSIRRQLDVLQGEMNQHLDAAPESPLADSRGGWM